MEEEKEAKGFSDLFKKIVNTGISAAFMTEDAVKNLISDLPLPKDAIAGLLQNAKNTKDEFVTSVKNELKSYLSKIDLSREIEKALDKYDLEINAKIKFKKKTKTKSE